MNLPSPAYGKRILLAAAALLAVGGPVAIGQVAKPLSFEVASVKPSPPPPSGRMRQYQMSGGPGTNDPGRFTCENFDIMSLILLAYDVPYYLLTAPDWTREPKFNIAAKVPDGATKAEFRLMLQNLLAERFKLVVHREKKEMPIYELVVAKGGHKLKEASVRDPKDQPDGPAPPNGLKADAEGFPLMVPGRTMMAFMMNRGRLQGAAETMEHFVVTLGGQLHAPVIDASGLTGKYDFTLTWLAGDSQPDNDTAPTLLNALPQQLGLTLTRTRGEVEVLVVDHVEKAPTEN